MKYYNLKELRMKKCLKQNEAAFLIGITPTYLSLLERGSKNHPSQAVMKSLARVYDVTPVEIFKAVEKSNIKEGEKIYAKN